MRTAADHASAKTVLYVVVSTVGLEGWVWRAMGKSMGQCMLVECMWIDKCRRAINLDIRLWSPLGVLCGSRRLGLCRCRVRVRVRLEEKDKAVALLGP